MLGPFDKAIHRASIHMNVKNRHENTYEFPFSKKGEISLLYPYHLPIGRRKNKIPTFWRNPFGIAEKEEEKGEKPKEKNPQPPKPYPEAYRPSPSKEKEEKKSLF